MNKEEKEWKIPEELQEIELPEFPINCLALELREYVKELAEELQVAEDMVGSAILTIISICNQGKYTIQAKKGWIETLNLYMLIVASPSERKSPICKRLAKPIYDYEREKNAMLKPKIISNNNDRELLEKRLTKLKKDLINNEQEDNKILKVKQEIKDIQEQLINFEDIHEIKLVADDVTPEALASIMIRNDEKMAIISAEGGIFATMGGRYNNNIPNCEIFLKSFSNEPIKIDRKGKEEETMYSPLLTMLLFVQPIVVEKVFDNAEFVGKGLCARFLYSFPVSKIGNRNIESRAVSDENQYKYNKMIKKLLDNEHKNEILILSHQAYQCFVGFWNWLEPQLNNELIDFKDWGGKLPGVVLRLAGNLHVAENYENETYMINEKTMQNAIELGKYYLKHAQSLYTTIGTNYEHMKAKRILRILEKNKVKGSMKRHDVFRMVRGREIQKIEDVLEPFNLLIEWRYIREIEVESGKTGRKGDTIIQFNPLYFK